MSFHSGSAHALSCLFLLSTEPNAPPQNVIAMAISSTEIAVSWKEVPAIYENGIIIVYEVQYVPLQTFGDQISTNTTNTTYLNTTLTGLQEYVEYNISVRAYTSVGPGPYSDPVTERTLEDGIYTYYWHIYTLTNLLFSPEPAVAPENVATMAVSSTEIEVSWEKVPAIDENGIIIVYEVQYVPLQTFGDQISTNTTNTTYLNTTLTGLEEYVEYNISVRAYTSVGPGPYSDPVTERTLEDGRVTVYVSQSPLSFLYRA